MRYLKLLRAGTIRTRLYGLAILVTVLLAVLCVISTLQLSQLSTTTTALSDNTSYYIQMTRILEKGSELAKVVNESVRLEDDSGASSYQVRYGDLVEEPDSDSGWSCS